MMKSKRKVSKEQEDQPMLYWLVDITLTSGESLQFYVSAINEFEANVKADSYSELVENKHLFECYKKMGSFSLLP